jgi:hypothetical protein
MVQIAGVGSFTSGDFDAELKTTLELNRQAQATARQVLSNTVQLFTTQRELQQRSRALGLAEQKEGRAETLFSQRQDALENLKRIEQSADIAAHGPPTPGETPEEAARTPLEQLAPSQKIALGSERLVETRIGFLEAETLKRRSEANMLAGFFDASMIGTPGKRGGPFGEIRGNLTTGEVDVLGGPVATENRIHRLMMQMFRSGNPMDPFAITNTLRMEAQSLIALQAGRVGAAQEEGVPEKSVSRIEGRAEESARQGGGIPFLTPVIEALTSQVKEDVDRRRFDQLGKNIGEEIKDLMRSEPLDRKGAQEILRESSVGEEIKRALTDRLEIDKKSGLIKAKKSRSVGIPFGGAGAPIPDIRTRELTFKEQRELLKVADLLDIDIVNVLKGLEE